MATVRRQLPYLVFVLGADRYALNVEDVVEVIRVERPSRVPLMPNYIPGLIRFRGRVIPLIDLKSRLGLPTARGNSTTEDDARTVVVKRDEAFFGLRVDAVEDVKSLQDADCRQIASPQAAWASAVEGVYRMAGEPVLVFRSTSLLDFEQPIELSGWKEKIERAEKDRTARTKKSEPPRRERSLNDTEGGKLYE